MHVKTDKGHVSPDINKDNIEYVFVIFALLNIL